MPAAGCLAAQALQCQAPGYGQAPSLQPGQMSQPACMYNESRSAAMLYTVQRMVLMVWDRIKHGSRVFRSWQCCCASNRCWHSRQPATSRCQLLDRVLHVQTAGQVQGGKLASTRNSPENF